VTMKVIFGVLAAGLALCAVSGRPDQRNDILKELDGSNEIVDLGTTGYVQPPVEKPVNVEDKAKASKCGYEVI
jgi:hypothetical protein